MTSDPIERARLWRTMFVAMTHALNTVESELKSRHGLTLLDIGCLFAIRAAGSDGAPMGTLAARFAVDPSVITYRVKRLENRGVLQRRTSQVNRRFTYAALTEDGRELLHEARRQLLDSTDRHFFAHIENAQLSVLGKVFTALLNSQESEENPPLADKMFAHRRSGDQKLT